MSVSAVRRVKRIEQRLHLFRGSDGDAQEVLDAGTVEVAHQYAASLQLAVQEAAVGVGMAGKHEVGFAGQHFESHLPEPRNGGLAGVDYPLAVGHAGVIGLQCGQTRGQGHAVDAVGVGAELDLLQVGDQPFIRDGETQPRPGHAAGFGKGLHHQEVVVFRRQRHTGLGSEVHVGFIDQHHMVRVGL